MFVKLYPENPNPRDVTRIAGILRGDGVIIYPTDGVYAFGCSLASQKAIERLKTIRGKRDDELTIVCDGLSNISEYAQASGRIPGRALGRRRTVAVRVPANPIPVAIVRELGVPMVTASVKDPDEIIEYTTDPELIYERYRDTVDAVVDGGYGNLVPTTMVDLTSGEPEILREGGGELV